MRSLFRSLEASRVRYLVISGQASILYGAAHFSEDLDLWVDPSPSNLRSFLRALSRIGARVHKLTPPLTPGNVHRGHGFHFRVPDGSPLGLHLDVMGRPPRVGAFGAALRRAERLDSPWGRIPVVSIEDLVELKKTNRPADYEVITRLAMIRLAREPRPSPTTLAWALRNMYQAEELWKAIAAHGPKIRASILAGSPAARLLHSSWKAGRPPSLEALARAARLLAKTAQAHQDRGRAYWLPILDELRSMRSDGVLLREGTLAQDIPVPRS